MAMNGQRTTRWGTARRWSAGLAVAAAMMGAAAALAAPTGWKIVGWNNLGMHCMDADFAVFAILPPYNTIQAHVIDPSGKLVRSGSGITVTYQAVADPGNSINTTSRNSATVHKTDFWDHVGALFGATPAVDAGLAGKNMPGPANSPQPMTFDPARNWFIAEGIPITPYDDRGVKNYYPLMRLVARDATGAVLATTDITLPVSDEMDCTSCHASGSGGAAQPAGGWVSDADRQREFRRNILRLHDERHLGDPLYQAALTDRGYSSAGLEATAAAGTAILCAQCHGSEALPGSGYAGIPPLTRAMHSRHANVTDPTNGMTLESSSNRSACYRCHPGSETRCLRGAMGSAVAADGTMAIQCQGCHGGMSAVGASTRTGWLEEPSCQQCHTGTATHNNGQIRYASALEASGLPRQAVDATFATSSTGNALYRFSAGHGGLQCSACHGSTHAEYPSSHRNDNLQSVAIQGHVGTLGECASCHGASPSTVSGGPHGMHPVGQDWVSRHGDVAESSGTAQCRACHGADYRGTVLSRAFATRAIASEKGNLALWRGFQVGCYACHNGPSSESTNSNRPASVANASASTAAGAAVSIALAASDADGNPLTLRVVGQPGNGTAAVSGKTATYFPYAGFTGTDTFTFAAWDGSVDSNLGTVTVAVGSATPCTLACSTTVPGTAVQGNTVTFSGSATPSSCTGTPTLVWNFGDGSATATGASATHAYATAGTFTWKMTATLGAVSCSRTGTITVAPPPCTLTCSATVPTSGFKGTAVSFKAAATPSSCTGTPTYAWTFGDGATSTQQNPTHAYAAAGTFTWTVRATLGSASCTRTGTITITAPISTPKITEVKKLDSPFRLQLIGSGFRSGARVYLGSDTTPWPSTWFVSSTRVDLSGSTLSSRFPSGVTVTIRLVNPDGGSVTTSYRR